MSETTPEDQAVPPMPSVPPVPTVPPMPAHAPAEALVPEQAAPVEEIVLERAVPAAPLREPAVVGPERYDPRTGPQSIEALNAALETKTAKPCTHPNPRTFQHGGEQIPFWCPDCDANIEYAVPDVPPSPPAMGSCEHPAPHEVRARPDNRLVAFWCAECSTQLDVPEGYDELDEVTDTTEDGQEGEDGEEEAPDKGRSVVPASIRAYWDARSAKKTGASAAPADGTPGPATHAVHVHKVTGNKRLRVFAFNATAAGIGYYGGLVTWFGDYLPRAEEAAVGTLGLAFAIGGGIAGWRLSRLVFGHPAVTHVLPFAGWLPIGATLGTAEFGRRSAQPAVAWLDQHGQSWGLGSDAASLLMTVGGTCGGLWWLVDRRFRHWHWVPRLFVRIPLASALLASALYAPGM